MTRIDIHPPRMLCDQHLLSNHREIKRTCSRLRQRLQKNDFKGIPHKFYSEPKGNESEGKFHELFWIDKGFWTLARYVELYEECLRRGFNVEDYSGNWIVYDQKIDYANDFSPNREHFRLLGERITDRLRTMKSIRYFGKNMSFDEFNAEVWNFGKGVKK